MTDPHADSPVPDDPSSLVNQLQAEVERLMAERDGLHDTVAQQAEHWDAKNIVKLENRVAALVAEVQSLRLREAPDDASGPTDAAASTGVSGEQNAAALHAAEKNAAASQAEVARLRAELTETKAQLVAAQQQGAEPAQGVEQRVASSQAEVARLRAELTETKAQLVAAQQQVVAVDAVPQHADQQAVELAEIRQALERADSRAAHADRYRGEVEKLLEVQSSVIDDLIAEYASDAGQARQSLEAVLANRLGGPVPVSGQGPHSSQTAAETAEPQEPDEAAADITVWRPS